MRTCVPFCSVTALFLLQEVTIRVGAPVVVDDLIAEYERKHGPLKRYSASVHRDPPNFTWVSTPKGNTRQTSCYTHIYTYSIKQLTHNSS
jgi:hypothetical protein